MKCDRCVNKNTEYCEYIDFYCSSNQKNYVVQAKLGDSVVLYSNNIKTTYPLRYYWYHSNCSGGQ